MIYRKWSLLTGPVAILGGIVGAVIVAEYFLVDKDWFFGKREKRNLDANPSRKEDE